MNPSDSLNLEPQTLGEPISTTVPQKLKICTWNVWFDRFERGARNQALLEELAQHQPHVIAFQEVTPPFIRAIQAADWLKEGYWISATHHSQLGVVIVSRLPVKKIGFHPLESPMGRRLLIADFESGLTVASAHFESGRGASELRCRQLKQSFSHLGDSSSTILMGDFNSGLGSPEEELLKSKMSCTWDSLNPDVPCWTLDTEKNTMLSKREAGAVQARLDRVFFGQNLSPKSIHLLGSKPFGEGLYPSDHFGLLAEFVRE